jgi:hypothetical protein
MKSPASHRLTVFLLCIAAQVQLWAAPALVIDDRILRSIEEAKTPELSAEVQTLIAGLPQIKDILAKENTDIIEEERYAKERIAALQEAGEAPLQATTNALAEATGIVVVLGNSLPPAPTVVKGMLSCICVDKTRGLFLTAAHPFQQAGDLDRVMIIGRDGRIAGIARVLLRSTGSDLVLFTTRQEFTGEVAGIGKAPLVGDQLWVSGSVPGAVFLQLGAKVARAAIPDYGMFGRSRAKWFDLDRGFPSGLSGSGVFDTTGRLVGIAMRNISVTSHGSVGATLDLGRSIELYPLLSELR